MTYIDNNPAAVLSTVDDAGKPHGAVIYVCTASHGTVCFVTKNLTRKYVNITERPDVHLTFFNERESSTLQLEGTATVTDDPAMIDYVMKKMTQSHAIQSDWLPPVTKVQAGEYVIIGVKIVNARLAEFGGSSGDGKTFTDLQDHMEIVKPE